LGVASLREARLVPPRRPAGTELPPPPAPEQKNAVAVPRALPASVASKHSRGSKRLYGPIVHSRAALLRGDNAARAHARRSAAAGGALAVVDAAAWRQLQAATGILHLVAPGRGWR
jgi:hypothetical protein